MRRLILSTALVLPFLVLLYFIRTQKRFAHFYLMQIILISFFSQEANTDIIRKEASNKTVDCIDWNLVVDLSKHPLGPPHGGSQPLGQNNALKEHTKLHI